MYMRNTKSINALCQSMKQIYYLTDHIKSQIYSNNEMAGVVVMIIIINNMNKYFGNGIRIKLAKIDFDKLFYMKCMSG